MYGGRIRGQGTYGCVFQPALDCDTSDTDPNKVGKITSRVEARIEIAAADALRSIPNAANYVILPEANTCVPKPRNKQKDTNIKECNFVKGKPIEETIQLIMPWGGYSLSSINIYYREFDLYRFIEEILAAGTFLILHEMCHFDIGGHNILFDTNNVPRFIDFGFAFQASKLSKDDLPDYWRKLSTEHDTETPEITLVLGSDEGYPIQSLVSDLEKSKPAVRRLASLCDVVPSDWGSDLLDWSLQSKSFQQHDWLSCWKLYWPGFDAWAIGTVILEVLELQMMSPGFTETPQWAKRSSDVKELLRSLCHANPAKRLDAAEALSMWTKGTHPLIASGIDAVSGLQGNGIGSDWIQAKRNARPS